MLSFCRVTDFSKIRFRAVLACQEPAHKAIIENDTSIFFAAKRLKLAVVLGAVLEIVFRLKAFIARQSEFRTDPQSFSQASRREV